MVVVGGERLLARGNEVHLVEAECGIWNIESTSISFHFSRLIFGE
jgi:hypothetical protein